MQEGRQYEVLIRLGIHFFKLKGLLCERGYLECVRNSVSIINVVLLADGLDARYDCLEKGLVLKVGASHSIYNQRMSHYSLYEP